MFDCLMRTQKNKHMHSHVVYSMQNKVEARERDCKPKPIVRLIDVWCEKACNRATLGRANLHLDASVCLLDVWWKNLQQSSNIDIFMAKSGLKMLCKSTHTGIGRLIWTYSRIHACMYMYMCMYTYVHVQPYMDVDVNKYRFGCQHTSSHTHEWYGSS